MADTLTTRDAVRRATADDIIGRCQAAAVAIEGGALDGVEVVSLGTLRDQVTASLLVKLPPTSDKHAEVTTPATIVVSAICPECALPVEITVKLTPALEVDNDGAELKVRAKSKGRPHVHGQLSLPEEVDGQLGMDDVVIDDLRLRILRAVYDLLVDAGQAEERGETGAPISLDAIAQQLEIATESDRFDLDESLHAYSQAEPSLVEIHSAVDTPTTYVLTPAGLDLVDEHETGDEDDTAEADGDEPAAES